MIFIEPTGMMDSFYEYNGEMKLIMDRELDFNTKLTITRKTDVPRDLFRA